MPASLLASASKTLPDVSVGHALLQMVLALVVIVASILVLTKVLARIRGGAKVPAKRHGANGLAVVSRQSLGKDLSIATVRWNDREVLVGISGSTITFLNEARAEMPTPGVPAETPLGTAPAIGSVEGRPPAPFEPAVLAAARAALPRLAPAAASTRPSLLEQLRDATLRR